MSNRASIKQSERSWACLDSVSSVQLLSRLNASIEWAITTIKLVQPDSQLWCSDQNNNIIRPIDKMILEASLLALVAGRCQGARIAAENLMKEVAKHTEVISRIYQLIRRRPHLRTSLGLLWVAFDNFNCGDIAQRRSMRDLWEREPFPPQPHERVPYRLLDQAWVRSKAKGEVDPIIATGALVPFTSLGNFDGAPFMNRSDLYALTHTAMYITDFGEWSQPNSYSSEIMGAISLSRMMDGDFDLAAELIIADILVGDTVLSKAQITVRAVLNDVFDSLGLIPSLNFDQSEYELATDKDGYIRYHSYHTTFVYALLCYSVLRHQNFQSSKQEFELSAPKVRTWHYKDMTPLPNPIANLSVLAANHIHDWTGICRARGVQLEKDGSDLVRTALDAHLIHAVRTDAIDDILQLLSMSEIGGHSQIDQLVRTHISQRAQLAQAYEESELLAKKVAAEYDLSNLSTF